MSFKDNDFGESERCEEAPNVPLEAWKAAPSPRGVGTAAVLFTGESLVLFFAHGDVKEAATVVKAQ